MGFDERMMGSGTLRALPRMGHFRMQSRSPAPLLRLCLLARCVLRSRNDQDGDRRRPRHFKALWENIQ